jgi:pimeloyl-ACP methyl ester carboxylesterase
MAVFNPNIADEITAHYPEIENWVIGGHSVGGTMAAQYTGDHPETVGGLVIWASYPAGSSDISNLDIPVTSIYGSRDPAVNDASVGEREHLLPEDTRYIRIEGGDHHQFGSYMVNPDERHATISRESQHEQIIRATLELLQHVSQVE